MASTPDSRPSAAASAQTRDWPAYYDAMSGKPPRDTLLKALDLFEAQAAAPGERLALDLGCGQGRDTIEMLGRGWRVVALDSHPEGIQRMLAGEVPNRERLEARVEALERAVLPAATLVNASFTLPFVPPAAFGEVWGRIVASLPLGGRFSGQLFGDRDDWAVIEDRTHLTRNAAIALFDRFVLEWFVEEDRPSTDPGLHKHWHLFHIVARKRG
ncbi:MAG: class I SAM-dependent methyltransferase [Phycisphaeraceae bacterium]|nr:class I SAM-dependent methyltransferase [Phycisphaeraceae bacterium]